MKRSCSGVKMREIGRLPATMRLIWPRSTGIENDADFTIDVSLASASILKSRKLAPLRIDALRIDRAELDGAVVLLADDAARARDDAGLQQLELGRVEEVDEAFLVVVGGQAEATQRGPDLVIRHRGLDLDRLGAGHRLRHPALRGRPSLDKCHRLARSLVT